MSFKLEHFQESVISSTGNEALVFVPGDTLKVDIVGNSNLKDTESDSHVVSQHFDFIDILIGGYTAHLLAEINEHGGADNRSVSPRLTANRVIILINS